MGSSSNAAGQAGGYVDLIAAFPDLAPFFGDLFEALKAIYATGGELDEIRLDVSIPPRAEVWTPVDRIRIPAAAASPAKTSPLGPQNPGEGAFIARMRRHQSWWRAERLGVPWGTGPTKGSARELGNMLQSAAADDGRNFLTAGIHTVAKHRIAEGGGVEPFRCTRNLLSSQPMCFNLFGPFVDDSQLALTMLQPLLPVIASEITGVRIEYAPAPAIGYLNDRTAFEAFIEFRDENGELAFVGVETKLTEPFSQKSPDTPRYRALTEASGSPWTSSPPELADKRWNQLWRNQRLVEATRSHPSRPHGNRGWLAVVAHPEDPQIKGTTADYRKFLSDQGSVLEWPIDVVIAAFRQAALRPAERSWLNDFEDRYLNLAFSAQGAGGPDPGRRDGWMESKSQQQHNAAMSAITIRDVPDETHRELASRAAKSGRSLQSYLRDVLIELASRPDNNAILQKIADGKRDTGSALTTEEILGYREADRPAN